MATISISNLTGSDLFVDHETFLHDLSDRELNSNVGGSSDPVITLPVIASLASIAITLQVYTDHRAKKS